MTKRMPDVPAGYRSKNGPKGHHEVSSDTTHENPNEWIRFSLTWESIAAMSERLQASISLNALRPSGSVAASR